MEQCAGADTPAAGELAIGADGVLHRERDKGVMALCKELAD
jgi:hypothetical protein